MITILTRGGHTPQEGSNITGPCSYKSHQFSLIFAKYFLSPKLHNICAENCIIMPIFRILHVLLVMQTFYTKRGLVAITKFLKLHYMFLKLYVQKTPIFRKNMLIIVQKLIHTQKEVWWPSACCHPCSGRRAVTRVSREIAQPAV